MAKSKQCYYINHKHIAALKRSRPLSKGEVKKIKSEACIKVDSIRDEEIVQLYQELPEGEERDVQEAYINERAESRKKSILKLEANGLPILIFLLLCSTPKALGWKDSSCGGSCLDGFEFGECDSTIAVDNIIDTLIAMDIIQLVDANDKTRCDANNSRKCMITRKELEEMARWSCPSYTDREAKCTARFIGVYIETANMLNVPVIFLEAGGVTKGCSKVTDILVANKDIHIDLLLRNFWHIQFFNRKSRTMCDQVKIISDGVAALSSSLGKDQPESFEDIFWSIYKGRSWNLTSSADIEMAKTMYHERLEAGVNKEDIYAEIKDEFDHSTMKTVRHQVGVVEAMARYHKLKDENEDKLEEILAKLEEEGFTDKGVLKSVRSYANKTKKADERAVNKYNMIPARSDQIISVFCPVSNCNNTGFTKFIYEHSDGKTKIVRPRCGNKLPGRGAKHCRKTMDPVETPTPLETISEKTVQEIENAKAAAANVSSEDEVELLEAILPNKRRLGVRVTVEPVPHSHIELDLNNDDVLQSIWVEAMEKLIEEEPLMATTLVPDDQDRSALTSVVEPTRLKFKSKPKENKRRKQNASQSSRPAGSSGRAAKKKDRKEEEHWTSVLQELEHGLLCSNQPTLSKNKSQCPEQFQQWLNARKETWKRKREHEKMQPNVVPQFQPQQLFVVPYQPHYPVQYQPIVFPVQVSITAIPGQQIGIIHPLTGQIIVATVPISIYSTGGVFNVFA